MESNSCPTAALGGGGEARLKTEQQVHPAKSKSKAVQILNLMSHQEHEPPCFFVGLSNKNMHCRRDLLCCTLSQPSYWYLSLVPERHFALPSRRLVVGAQRLTASISRSCLPHSGLSFWWDPYRSPSTLCAAISPLGLLVRSAQTRFPRATCT